MRRAAVITALLLGLATVTLQAVRSYSERHEDAQRAYATLERAVSRLNESEQVKADLMSGLGYLTKLHDEDFGEHTAPPGAFRAGRPDQSRDDIQDFSVDRNDGQVRLRELYVQDIGDPPEVGMGRMGPDGAPYNWDSPQELPPGSAIALWYWRVWNRDSGWHYRAAQVYSRYQGNGSAGSLHFATSSGAGDASDSDGPPDAGLVDRLVLRHDGVVEFANVPVQSVGQRLRVAAIVNGFPVWLTFEERQ